uniref:Uncharacterized protein n=1 Tax=Anguilla anguilla TaxID=7936 RepID=A0A0E9PNA0_ANGAN
MAKGTELILKWQYYTYTLQVISGWRRKNRKRCDLPALNTSLSFKKI